MLKFAQVEEQVYSLVLETSVNDIEGSNPFLGTKS
jgi:hypothetical protein